MFKYKILETERGVALLKGFPLLNSLCASTLYTALLNAISPIARNLRHLQHPGRFPVSLRIEETERIQLRERELSIYMLELKMIDR